MPADSKGPRLWLRKARRDKRGRITHRAVWLILDGEHQESTECGRDNVDGAEKKLELYLARKRIAATKKGQRDPDAIPVADVIALYAAEVAPTHSRPKETGQRLDRLLAFFGDDMLSALNGDRCRQYAVERGTEDGARRDLEDLRSAVNYHRKEGYCDKTISIVLPEKSPPRDEWATRSQIAKALWTAWRFREMQHGVPTDRRPWRHVARFVLIAVYTGTRAGAVCAAALEPTEGRGWIDPQRGIFYRRPKGATETKKRRPPVPLPNRLLAHLRRWKRLGYTFPVEWNGRTVKDVDKAFRHVAHAAGMPWLTPHVLRHTAATWLMFAGVEPMVAAEYLGMSLKTLLENYFHHHPDYLASARTALDRPPMLRQRMAGNYRERAASNVTKIADRSR